MSDNNTATSTTPLPNGDAAFQSHAPLHLTVWNEYLHEKKNPVVAGIYPHGIHEAIAAPLRKLPGVTVGTATPRRT